MSLGERVRARLTRRRGAAGVIDITSSRVRVLWALVLIAALLALPVGRAAGYRLADALCTGYGCAQATGAVPQCSSFGRDRAVAAETMSYARSAIDRPDLHLRGSGDGAVEITASPEASATAAPGGRSLPEDARLTYRFTDIDEARHWLLDHTESTGRAVDASTGPASTGAYAGYLRAFSATGLLQAPGRTPQAVSRPVTLPAFEAQPAVLSEELGSGLRTQTIVPDFPLPDTPSLTHAAHRLGISDALVVEIVSTAAGEPQRLRFSGWGTEGWSLDALRAPDSADIDFSDQVDTDSGELIWRSYSLDLRRTSNRTVFDDLTEDHRAAGGPAVTLATGQFGVRVGTGQLDRNPYTALVDRLRQDAVFVEAQVSAPGLTRGETLTPDQLRPTHLRDVRGHALTVNTVDVRSADLSLAGATLVDVFSCETPGGPAPEDDAPDEDAPADGEEQTSEDGPAIPQVDP